MPPDADLTIGNIDYPGGFYRDLAPVHLKYLCTINGLPGPDPSAPFDYCELGCGIGETTSILAAAYPQGRFVGIDLSPTHIDRATALATAADLDNVEFIAADIATFDTDELPEFDFVTLHGLYAWVPAHVQAAIREFLRRKLRPGGIAYLSYNAMPGWGSAGPMRHYFAERVGDLDGDLLSRVRRIVAELVELRDQDAPYFHDNPVAATILRNLETADPRYIAHEYLGSNWDPRYFTGVHDEMQACGLRFVGQAAIVESLVEHSVAPAFVERLQQQPDVRARENLRDFIQNRLFRRDVYMKPDLEQEAQPDESPLGPTLFSLVADPAQIPDTVKIPDAPWANLEGPWYERVKQRLGYRVLTFEELCGDPLLSKLDRERLAEALKLMTVGGFCVPCVTRETEPAKGPTERIRVQPQFNEVWLERHDWSQPSLILASPVAGNGVALNGLEAALLISLCQDRPLSWVWSQLQEKGIGIQSEKTKVSITDDDEGLQALEEAMQRFLRYKLPKLAYLGIVAAAD